MDGWDDFLFFVDISVVCRGSSYYITLVENNSGESCVPAVLGHLSSQARHEGIQS